MPAYKMILGVQFAGCLIIDSLQGLNFSATFRSKAKEKFKGKTQRKNSKEKLKGKTQRTKGRASVTKKILESII